MIKKHIYFLFTGILSACLFVSCSCGHSHYDYDDTEEYYGNEYEETDYSSPYVDANADDYSEPIPAEPIPQNTMQLSRAYEEGYERGYDDGEEDGIQGEWGDNFDDSNNYKGKKKSDYELGYEEGYEAGFDDTCESEE